MSGWQRPVRLVIAMIGVAGAVYVALQFKSRPPQDPSSPVVRTDPTAVFETTRGASSRTTKTSKQGDMEYDLCRTYDDNSTKCFGVKITAERSGRTYVTTGKELFIGNNESETTLTGNVEVTASDGLTLRTETATNNDADGMLRGPGPVEFSRGRMSGSAVGFTYSKVTDVLHLLDKAVVRIAPGEDGDAIDMRAATAIFNRPEHLIHFNGQMRAVRRYEVTEADTAIARLRDDEEQLQRMELRGQSRITGSRPGGGALRGLKANEIDLDYGEDGQSITRAALRGNSLIAVSGERSATPRGRRGAPARGRGGETANREITGTRLDVALAPDGSTPTGIVAQENAQLTIPADDTEPARTISAQSMTATGNEKQGLTNARFTGKTQFRERGDVPRVATSEVLDVTLASGLSTIEEARFTRNVEFVEAELTATAAAARYDLDRGTLQLSGTESVPRIRNNRIDVRAAAMDLEFEGPQIVGKGNVRSVLLPSKNQGAGKDDPKVPSMLKADEDVNVNARELNYDGKASKATFTGEANLFQAGSETRIRAGSITIDDKTGDLSASGNAVTNTILVSENKDKKKERQKSEGTGKDFRYEENTRRATYDGGARLIGMLGTLDARKIELYLKPSGDEIERVLGFNDVVFTENKRKATGTRFDYVASDDRYEIKGTPVVIVDECGKPAKGLTLVYFRKTDRMTLDGGDARTQSRSGRACS
jgi:lipopolysaccharide export system protein LptA